MGSVSTHHGTELQLALSELGVPDHYTIVRKAAGGHDPDSNKITWFHLRSVADGDEVLALTYTNRSKKHGVWCKVVSESMGPGELDVPHTIWANMPPCPGKWAADWRERVTAFKAAWPLRLSDVPVGAECEVFGYEGTFRRFGGHAGLSAPLFTSHTTFRTVVFNRWRERRARLTGGTR
jgi:hypothetical protein